MMAQARLWWSGRSGRERWLLGTMATLFAVMFVWLAVIRPLDSARLRAALRLDAATLDAGRIRAVADAMRAQRGGVATLNAALPVVVGQAASSAGFTLGRLDGQGANRVDFAIATARSPALFAWLDSLEREGVIVDRINLRTNSDGTLGVEGVLRTRGR